METKVYLLQDGEFVSTKYKECDYRLVNDLIHNDLGISFSCFTRLETLQKYKDKTILCLVTCVAMDEHEIRALTFVEVIE